MLYQRTLKRTIHAVGVALHAGVRVKLSLHPAQSNAGIVFRRVDLPDMPVIPASCKEVSDTHLCTTLGHGTARVSTVEHLMAALSGLGIDNAVIDVNGPEVPILDGSAAAFAFLIQSAGVTEQDCPKQFVRIVKPVRVTDGERWAAIEPFNGFKVSLSIAFDHPLIPANRSGVSIDFGQASFLKEVGRARTFGFLRDIERMHESGLALGGSLDNAVVFDEYRVLNEEGLRYPDECARHKALDAVGDLYLFGRNLIGAFSGHKTGHALNHALLRAVLTNQHAWESVVFPDRAAAPSPYGLPALAH